MRRRFFSIIGLCIMALFVLSVCATIAPAHADGSWATVCEVRTTDAEGNPKVEFGPGERVYIHWNADGMVNMTVYAPDGTTIDQEWTALPSSGVNDFVPSHGNGLYEVDCTGAETKLVAVGTILVIPQLPFLGTLLALCTMLGAAFIIKRRSIY